MKDWLWKMVVSRAGGILTPVAAVIVAAVVARIAVLDVRLAESVDQGQLTGFLVALALAAVNYFTNRKLSGGVKKIQAMVNTDVDGVPGPVTYTEVRRAIAVEGKR